jgi:hypothetical protein
MLVKGSVRARKKATRLGVPINVWLPQELHAAVWAYLRAQKVTPSLSQVVRTALKEFLAHADAD